VENEEVVALQRSFHHKRGHGRPDYCDKNSRIPQTAVPIIASKTAEAGYVINLEKAGKAIIVLPGTAASVSSFAAAGLEQYLCDRRESEGYSVRVNLIACNLKQLAAEAKLIEEEEGVRTEIFPMTAETALIISADSERRCKKALKRLTASEAGDSIYGTDTDLATEIVRILAKHKKTVSFAESCTGGLAASMLVAVPGSSEVFDGSLVTYANQIKHDYLEVRSSTLENDGAVSRKCAAQMAEGARRAMHADYGVAITGIAGPGGGSPEKPVGLVYIAVSERGESASVHKFNFHGSRSDIRRASASYALRELYRVICDL
jgi:nicotinamide-nucleotide amidase